METITVQKNQEGQRLDRILARYLEQAPKSFFYRMLRKKNITLNGKKAAGNERLKEGDTITLFLSPETIARFQGDKRPAEEALRKPAGAMPEIVYEDREVLLFNKPAGMLTQKARKEDTSLNDWLLYHALDKRELTGEELNLFRPSVCNQLDRNTSGLVTAGKTLAGLREMNSLLRERTMKKYYLTLAAGQVKADHVHGYLAKDSGNNQVKIYDSRDVRRPSDAVETETAWTPLEYRNGLTLLKVHLITGRSHQIRAQLAWAGHPVAGDGKYGSPRLNRRLRENYGLKHQLLHAWQMEFPLCTGALSGLSGSCQIADPPALFRRILREEGFLWQPGIPEA